LFILFLVTSMTAPLAADAPRTVAKPNILGILADDLG